jgi:hypothetical protein
MDNSQYTPSELIDLALDCELDHNQATGLFEQLSHDSSLQEEFRQAVAIRRALLNDVLASIPSIEFTNNLFQRAGIEVPVDAYPPNVTQSGVNWASLATTAVVFLGVGIFAMFGLSKFYGNHEEIHKGFSINLPKIYELKIAQETISASNNDGQLLKNSENTLSPFHTPTYHHKQKASKGTTDGITIMSENDRAELSVGLSSVDISIAEPQNNYNPFSTSIVEDVEELPQNISVNYSNVVEDETPLSANFDRGVSVQVRGILVGKLFNNQSSVLPSPPIMNNMGLTLKYDISDKHSIGIEAGQESFPGMIETSDGRLQPTASISWMGITYQYSFQPIKQLGSIKPFIQTIGGGTGVGPIAKGIIGVSLPIRNRMSLFTAAEGTVMGYRYNSSWYSAQKISFCTGMMLTF